ncbi:MAG: aminomethyl-transferring glycine dehydrogenase subunit GcvPA [Parachlamydiaceae bacterium]|nr:aminomethyl-transferring glycine dehydrogenase subunit GcvPA [Parachlamydiaceae bacterium]
MDFISNSEKQNREMLAAIGVSTVEELFAVIPEQLRLARPTIDDGISEYEGIRLMETLAAKNSFPKMESYLGAGAYEHHVPALVNAICSKSEFLTSYTPYQAEASQGMLQCIFEFQSAMCALTGLDVANASVYDGASACAEAMLMALRHQKERTKVLIAATLHPHYRSVIDQYLCRPDVCVESIPFLGNGAMDMESLERMLDDSTAAVLVQYPHFLGGIDDVRAISERAKRVGALTIVCANPLVYGLFACAGELGVDIAVGDCQPLGLPLQFGGPYAGYITCKQELMRQLPGRIVGETVDIKGERGFVLTLQAREQHIRREKATSNICTNQALSALASLVTLLWYGKQGLRKLALTNYQRASYLREGLRTITEKTPFVEEPVFNEFVVKFKRSVAEVQSHFRLHGIEPGFALETYYPSLKDCMLVAVTETKSKEQLDHYLDVARRLA